MGQSVLADNWSLQVIQELLTQGLTSDDSSFLEIDAEGIVHQRAVPTAVVAFEALFDLLTDIVLRDQILVDGEYSYTWEMPGGPFDALLQDSILRRQLFPGRDEKIAEPRDAFVARLATTTDLKRIHAASVSAWGRDGSKPYPFESQVMWGGAGMLARAFVFETPYTPHPTRKRFFQRAGILLPDTSAADRLVEVIRHGRASLSRRTGPDESLMSLRVLIDPIPLRVIREATSAGNMLSMAIQLRSQYQRLRDWLGEYQQWLSDGASSKAGDKDKVLRELLAHADSVAVHSEASQSTFNIGMDGLSLSFGAKQVQAVRNRFGVRSMINKMIFDTAGAAELNKLLGFFDARGSTVELSVREHFSTVRSRR